MLKIIKKILLIFPKKEKEVKYMIKNRNININALVLSLANLISCGKNSVYKVADIAYRLIQAAIENQSLEAMYKLTKYLSADRMLDRLHNVSFEAISKLVEKKNKKMHLPKKVILALDFTEKSYYGDKNHPEVMGSKGGKYVRRFLEMSTVKPALFINALPVNQLTNDKKSLITELLDAFYERFKKTRIDLLLLDRGFFSKEVVTLLVKKNVKFIMPAVKNKAIARLIDLYKEGEIKDSICYQFGNTKVYLKFIKIEDDVLVYMTNTTKSPMTVHIAYKKRWQIETNFREQNKYLFKTNTKNFTIRYLAFVLAGLLFNLWQITRNKFIYKPESYIFKQILKEKLLCQWQAISKKEVIKSIDYLLA